MFDAYAPPGSDEPGIREPLVWVGYARAALWFVGVCYCLIGLLYGGGLFLFAGADPELPEEFGLVFGVIMLVLGCGFGVVNFLVAAGLAREAKWAWFGGVIIGGLYAGSICLPFGGVILYGLLQEDARKRFLG